MASTISAQEVVWVQPVDSAPYETPLNNTANQWTPYRDASQRIDLLPPVDFNLEQDTFASEPIADLDPIEPGSSRRKKPSFGRGAPLSMGGFWAPNTPVVNQPANLQMNAQFARVAMPLGIPEEGKPLWLAIAKFGRLELATNAILPDSAEPVPSQFWLVETGVTHIRPLASGSTVGGTFLFGSASDKPFYAGRDLTLMSILFATVPARNQRDDWSFSLFYSPTSQLPYPLPGIAYVWKPDETLEAKIGLPAGIEWRPNDDWEVTFNYFPLVNVNAMVRRRLADKLWLFGGYRTDTQIYFLADRLIEKERFYVFDQRAGIGLDQQIGAGFSLEFLASYLFDRELFQGTSFTSGRTDVVEFDPGLGLSLQLLWRR
ncbi:MAG TPA: hypothetical protein DEB70_06270 [Planctomycetaceae bacterium]|nr:hypothetical protein [Planctomycetaceae bacterium]